MTLFTHGKKPHASVTVTVVRDRKIQTTLRTNQIAEFVTVTAWKKINNNTHISLTSFVLNHECEAKDVPSIVIQIKAPFMQRANGKDFFEDPLTPTPLEIPIELHTFL